MKSYEEMCSGLLTDMPDRCFADLPNAQKKLLLTLLSRVSETSYRRGAQQGVECQQKRPAKLPACVANWRYDISQDLSPGLDSPRMDHATDRLLIEHAGALGELGLRIEEDYDEQR